jgi:serine/threonine protein kinase
MSDRYELLERIGSAGASAEVFKARDLVRSRYVAIKRFYGMTHKHRTFESEKALLSKLSHPSFPTFNDYYRHNERWHLVMEYFTGKDVSLRYKSKRRGSNGQLKRVLCDGLEAIQHLHCTGFVHRDIKPRNVVVGHRIGIVDLGLAKHIDTEPYRGGGTRAFMAPEQFDRDFCFESDVWGLAATVMYYAGGVVDLAQYGFVPEVVSDPSLMNVLRRMLEKDAEKRVGVDEALDMVRKV